jgi:nucleoid-associated protein YgaU
VIFGLSRIVVFAAITATAGVGIGAWYFLSEDERSAPVVQRESVTSQETAPAQPVAEAPDEVASQPDAGLPADADGPETDPADAPDLAEADAVQAPLPAETAADEATSEETASEATASEEAVSAQAPAAIETLVEEEVAALTDPAAPATEAEPAPEPEIAQPRLPTFDTVRVEPTGEAVIAGRDAPEGDVALLRDGEIYDETFAGPSGAFVFIPAPFPIGMSDVTLRATDADGNVLISRESVTIIVDADRARMPMVALTAPGRPTEVLSRPEPVQVAEAAAQETTMEAQAPRDAAEPGDVAEAPAGTDAASPRTDEADAAEASTAEPDAAPATETQTTIAAVDPQTDTGTEPVSERAGVRIVAVEAETGGGLFVSGESAAQAAIRLYLNDTLVARAESDAAGDVSFAIRRGVRAGRYQIRLDDVDPATGTVLSRAEVGFTVPEAVAALPEPEAEPAPAAEAQMRAGSDAQEAAMQEARLQDAESADTAAAEPARDTDTPSADATSDAAPIVIGEAESPVGAPAAVEERTEATVVVPELSTALVERGDSLWRISRQVYGRGIRYTEIFEANQDQIRNPNLIYPGQVFVLPPDQEAAQEDTEEQVPAAQ